MDLPFSSKPPPFSNSNPEWTPDETIYWRDHLLPKLLQEGAIRPLTRPTQWVSSSRLEPKRSGGFRHLVDLRPINEFIQVPRVKYETLASLPALARSGDGGVCVDMLSGYYALGIAPEFQDFLCFCVDGKYYTYTALPFGLNISPLVYTKFMRVVVSFLRYPKF